MRCEIDRLLEIMRFDVGNVQETVATYADIDKGRLKILLGINDDAFIHVTDIVIVGRSFDKKFF